MEALRPTLRAALYPLVVLAGLLLAGCSSTGIFGGDDDDDYEYDRDADRITEVRGRVERVDTRDRIIYVEPSGVYRSDLRNQDEEIELYYDDDTRVEYDGRTYEPRDLEPGDRIVADVDDDGRRLEVHDIEVTYDVTSGDVRDDEDDDRYAPGDDRYDDDRDADYEDDDRYDRDRERAIAEVRGKVRWLDQDRRVLELEDASWGWGGDRYERDDVIEVHYDADTVVEFEGRRYEPRNLERGDEVQIEIREDGSRFVTDEILVVASVRD